MAKLVHNLAVRRAACRDSFPGVAIGWIGDAAHQAEHSDHNPDARGIVHAIDVMVRGSRAEAVVTWALLHPDDLEYVIHNRTIWTRSRGFRPKQYHGTDPHTNHVHISGRHGSAGKDAATGTGYDAASELLTPAGTPLDIVKPAVTIPKVPATATDHRLGRRELAVHVPVMRGDDVKFVQRFIGRSKCGAPDGKFGQHTRDGVIWYQGMRGISVTGKVDTTTWRNMGVRA
ncbi:MAG TPA: peptidoglycan-binding domain-containing protein [Micromonosporaceae bacterium]|nr:peptidoglycan-binding domain-containing protein [Micromonosporaceae bacterium]